MGTCVLARKVCQSGTKEEGQRLTKGLGTSEIPPLTPPPARPGASLAATGSFHVLQVPLERKTL